MTANSAARLLQHYVDNFRSLPWRSPPGGPAPDPYQVWLSEVMLQQTTVAAVTARFTRFLERWPTIGALAQAPDSDVLQEWAGLGYYARARNLIACAREVVRRGGFPGTAAELRALPGVGAYTAGAIAAIAFGEDVTPVDTNVRRVTARLHGRADPAPGEIEALAHSLLPSGRAGDFVQALMDLGATICRPRAPDCARCPLAEDCVAFKTGRPEEFPLPKARAKRPIRHGIAFWIEREGQVWLVRRPPTGVLGGMAALPGTAWTDVPDEPRTPLGIVRHVFTHFELRLGVETRDDPVGDGWWVPIDALDSAGLPTLYRRAAALARAERVRGLPNARATA